MTRGAEVVTLDQLKAQNEAEEQAEAKAAEEQAQAEAKLEEEELDEVIDQELEPKAEEEEKPEGDEDDPDNEKPEESKAKPLEAWMEGEDSPNGQKSEHVDGQVPVGVVKDLRAKLRDVKSEGEDKDATIEQLRAQLAEAQQGVKAPAQSQTDLTQPLKVPMPHEFETDEEYQVAMTKHFDAEYERRESLRTQTEGVKQRQTQAIEAVEKGVTGHLERAVGFIQEYGIGQDTYKEAELNFRRAVANVHGDKADAIVDGLIAQMGKGSERVIFSVGKNKSQQAELISALQTDQSGVKASIYLGKVQERVSAKPSNSSAAPEPAKHLNGGDKKQSGSAMKRAYTKAFKAGNTQESFNIKQKAKREGVDTSNW